MKRIILLFIAGSCGLLWAQTNVPMPGATEQEIGVNSDHFYYDGKARELVYYDNVVATNWEGQLTCGRLTILLPPEGSTSGHPTNVRAETNVVIDFLKNGETNHIESDKAVYAYGVANGVTNETITFTGHAMGTNSQAAVTGEPLVWDNVAGRFTGSNYKSIYHPKTEPANGTNNPTATKINLPPGADTNFPSGKLDLAPPRRSDNPTGTIENIDRMTVPTRSRPGF
jgi:lipopolysaccharide export system protein LptA